MAMDAGKLITFAAVGVGGWWLYDNLFASSSSIPSDAQYVGQLPAGSAYAVPQSFTSLSGSTGGPTAGTATTAIAYVYHSVSTGLFYLSYTAPTAAQIPPTTTTPAASATGSSATTTPASSASGSSATTATPSTGTTSTLAQIWAKAQAAAAPDASFIKNGGSLTPYQWNFYISYVQQAAPSGYSGTWPPDPQVVFPGVDLTQPMSAATYWASMQPAMAVGGLSGLLAGLGCYDCFGMGDAASDATTAGDIAAFNSSGAAALLDADAGGNFTGGVSIPSSAPGGQTNIAASSNMNWYLVGAAALAIFAVVALPGSRSDRGGRY